MFMFLVKTSLSLPTLMVYSHLLTAAQLLANPIIVGGGEQATCVCFAESNNIIYVGSTDGLYVSEMARII